MATVSIPPPKSVCQPIERGVQLRDNCLGLISDDDQFDIDLFVSHLNTSTLQFYACPTPRHTPGSRVTGKPEVESQLLQTGPMPSLSALAILHQRRNIR
jgi:hypothetical protein